MTSWTNDRPEISGWYWYRCNPTSKSTIHRVIALSCHGNVLAIEGGIVPTLVSDMYGEWSGPIPEPAPPTVHTEVAAGRDARPITATEVGMNIDGVLTAKFVKALHDALLKYISN